MTVNELKVQMDKGNDINYGEALDVIHKCREEAYKICTKLNKSYKSEKKIVKYFSKLTGREVDKSLRLFPPFYSDFGKNIHVGKNVIINSNCNFQDQGGVYIGDNCLIGHRVVFATLNHGFEPEKRKCLYQKPIRLENNVWIGSGSIILQGVTIGENSIIGAGSVVTKDIPSNVIAVGNPARVIRKIKE